MILGLLITLLHGLPPGEVTVVSWNVLYAAHDAETPADRLGLHVASAAWQGSRVRVVILSREPVEDARIGEAGASDHRPLIVRLRRAGG